MNNETAIINNDIDDGFSTNITVFSIASPKHSIWKLLQGIRYLMSSIQKKSFLHMFW